jgi:glycogen(starch) synthase
MRVLIWSELFWPYIGGTEVLLAKLIPALRDRGHEFLVVTSEDYLDLPGRERYDGIPIERLPLRAAITSRDVELVRDAQQQVAALKRAFAPDLVHASGVGPSLFFHLRTADVHPAPLLLCLQNEVPPGQRSGDGTLLYRAMLSASWVAACSQAALAQARRLVPEIASRSSVIRNGYDLTPGARGAPPSDVSRLLCLGRLIPAKGLDVALTAFATLTRRFPALRLVIAGDGSARPALERQADELGVRGSVDFLGWVAPDRIRELLEAATVVVMPSRREGLPLAAVQAALMGRPVVASRTGGLPEVVVHRRTGMLVEAEDARGLSEAVAFLLERPDVAASMGRAARNRARRLLSLDRCVDSYDALYRTLTRT